MFVYILQQLHSLKLTNIIPKGFTLPIDQPSSPTIWHSTECLSSTTYKHTVPRNATTVPWRPLALTCPVQGYALSTSKRCFKLTRFNGESKIEVCAFGTIQVNKAQPLPIAINFIIDAKAPHICQYTSYTISVQSQFWQ